jgi:FAD/FMN-containing dehydrogenase/Fe-S oxidoreductase
MRRVMATSARNAAVGTGRAASGTGPRRDLAADLTARVAGEVRFDAGSRAAYATDASNYRQPPIGVVVPYEISAGVEALAVCAEHGVPVLSRGGGTSLAGQCCNTAVVIDWSKYCNRLVSIDPERRRVVTEPGACLDDVNEALEPHGLMVGPRPSTHAACTIGGMIGNNSCGASAQAYGKMVDSVVRLEVVTYDGARFWVGETSDADYETVMRAGGRRAEIYRALRELRDNNLEPLRTRYPKIPRRISGYNLDSLLPERRFHVARALVGSESTLVTVLHAEISVVPRPAFQSLVVLGYPDIARAGDAVPAVAAHEPLALEGVDATLVDLARADRLAAEDDLAELPEGSGWLMVRLGGDSREEADERAHSLLRALHTTADRPTVSYLDDPGEEMRLWRMREAGLGATAYPPGRHDTHEGWEDAAVPPDRVGDYLRDFSALIDEFGYGPVSLYGHFGHGCIHTRIPFELKTPAGIDAYRRFAERAASLVASYGGSLSGEHGDGQSRAELLPIMFGDEMVTLFGRAKAIFDPGNRMNPGKLAVPVNGPADGPPAAPAADMTATSDTMTAPRDTAASSGAVSMQGGTPVGTPAARSAGGRLNRLDEDLVFPGYRPAEPATYFDYPADGGRFTHAAGRCVGIGKCRSSAGGVMCPSYRVTREERHTTRGRARLLTEMMRGEVIRDGWRSAEVLDALDLCLACKGCRGECPVHVDMATYKAEFLAHHYARRLRPISHYSMGWLPLWARVAARWPGAVNALLHTRPIDRAIKWAAGIDPRRELPYFARPSLRHRRAGPVPRGPGDDPRVDPEAGSHPDQGAGDGRAPHAPPGPVVLWPDTFTNHLHPGAGTAAVRVLESAGFAVEVPPSSLCCGLTLISTGQLAIARRVLRRTLAVLGPRLREGVPVVGLEPSCTAVFRSDAAELLPDVPEAALLRDQTRSLAELLLERAPGSVTAPLPGTGRRVIAQPHCHQHALWGYDADRRVLELAGVQADVLDVGCCGMAGNFGFERGHYELSVGCAELGLWPAVREAAPEVTVLADGFSCRTQIETGTGRTAVHLAELLADLLVRTDLPA